MGILDKEIKRIKADDRRLGRILKALGYTAYFGYNPSDQDDIFTVTCMIELPDNKVFTDSRTLMTRAYYNSIDDIRFKCKLDDWVAKGETIIVDDYDDTVNKAFRKEILDAVNKLYGW